MTQTDIFVLVEFFFSSDHYCTGSKKKVLKKKGENPSFMECSVTLHSRKGLRIQQVSNRNHGWWGCMVCLEQD